MTTDTKRGILNLSDFKEEYGDDIYSGTPGDLQTF